MKSIAEVSGIMLIMLMSMLFMPFVAFAQDDLNDSIPELKENNDDFIEIDTIEGLNNVRNDPDGNYKLITDLDLSQATIEGGDYYNGGNGWTPICTSEDGFCGVFDGNGYTIRGVNSKGEDGCNGLFGINSGTIKNLKIAESCFDGTQESVGAVSGENHGAVDNCQVTDVKVNGEGRDITEDIDIGGITGLNAGSVENCSFAGTISAKNVHASAIAGGIVGSSVGPIIKCNNSGSISSYSECDDAYAGGIVGFTLGTNDLPLTNKISECANTGAIYAHNGKNTYDDEEKDVMSGGIAGFGGSESTQKYVIEGCRNKGVVSAKDKGNMSVGGIVGGLYKGIIRSSSNSGRITGELKNKNDSCGNSCGGIVGKMETSTVERSYNTGIITQSKGGKFAASFAGGIAGSQEFKSKNNRIEECYNAGSVTGIMSAGGIIADNYGKVMNCYNTGIVTGEKGSSSFYIASGIVAFNNEGADVRSTYNVGRVIGGDYPNGIIGFNYGSFTNATVVTISYASPACLGSDNFTARGKTASYNDMLKASTFSYNFNTVWKMGSGKYKFPVLRRVADTNNQNSINLCKCINMHLYGSWKTFIAPTTTRVGMQKRTCLFCGKEYHGTKALAPTGKVMILNTIANSAKKTNDVVWNKSGVKGANAYEINWRAPRASKWATKTVGNVVRGTTSGLTIGGLYEIRVRPLVRATSNYKATYGTWSNTIYRYFHTTESIRLKSTGKGSFTMSWKKNPKATSYQVLYTTNSNGAGAANNIRNVSSKNNSYTQTGLKSGKIYYVQVREVRRVNGVNYIGNISCPLAVKVK